MPNYNNIDAVKGALKNKKVVLLILDGWGMSPAWSGNAITFSNPQYFNKIWRTYPHTVLQAFKNLLDKSGNVGNSEIGHASIGTGRVVRQDITEINEAIKQGYFFQNPELIATCRHVKKYKSKLHLIGMLSDGAIHSHIDHLFALLKLAKLEKINQVYIHVICDGIDTPDRSAIRYVKQLNDFIAKNNIGKIVTLVGRFYAMDKSGNSERIKKTYELQTQGKGKIFNDAESALKFYYSQNIFDAYIPPCVISETNQPITISDYDGIIFYNFRPDRASFLASAYVDKNYPKNIFSGHKILKDIYPTTLTSYMLKPELRVSVAFPTTRIENNLSYLLSRAGLKQIHIAEAEKKAHVTYFFNGANAQNYRNEDWAIVNSPNTIRYDQTPAMSSNKIADLVIRAIKNNKYQFIMANFANVDMVAHTGNILATSDAVQIISNLLKKIIETDDNFTTIITADHGNAEQIIPYKTSSNKETFHTANPVPFIICEKGKENNLKSAALHSQIDIKNLLETPYTLADVAPTILELFGITKPQDMTGQSLLSKIGYK